jgi:type I site-specific restriction-modification system R (restriction) subunit
MTCWRCVESREHANPFKDARHASKVVIVCGLWLTGFDGS